MYISTFNPNQAVALSQGYQSGATAFPVALRSNPQGNTITYAFNPMFGANALALSQMATGLGIQPTVNPLSINPTALSQTLAFNQAATQGMVPFSSQAFINPATSAQIFGAPIRTMAMNTIQASSGISQVRVDLAETNSDIIVACELPNVSLNDLSLTVTDDSLSISATAWAGTQSTSVFRTVALPTSIKAEQVEATYANGILEIRAPKSDVLTRRKVKVNIAQ